MATSTASSATVVRENRNISCTWLAFAAGLKGAMPEKGMIGAAMGPVRLRAALLAAARRLSVAPMSESGETPRRNLTAAAAPALIAAALSALGAFALVSFGQGAGRPEAPIPGCILEGAEVVGGPISLVDHNAAPVTQADFAGEPMVLYFGYTNCPDVCPISLNTLADALAEPGGFDVQTAFITLDPERDTPLVIGQYVGSAGFPPGLLGLTGTPAQIGAAKAAFQVHGARAPGGEQGVYLLDHSSMVYVLDNKWKTVAIMPTIARADPANPESALIPVPHADLARCIARGLERRTS